ncbi:MAG TPA: hypothetical protein VGH40_04510 [Roseiarcus sp.]|jgi:hypothetical protein
MYISVVGDAKPKIDIGSMSSKIDLVAVKLVADRGKISTTMIGPLDLRLGVRECLVAVGAKLRRRNYPFDW